MHPPFELHPRLAADTVFLGDWPLCRMLLMNVRQYPWFVLVPRRAGLRELCELTDAEQQQLLKESNALQRALLEGFAAHKLNVAALGNLVPQLHVHHLARYPDDAAWPAPVWGRHAPEPYEPAARDAAIARLKTALPADLRAALA